jgi:hypothetical protein
MHDPDEWALEAGTRTLALDDVKRLPFHTATARFDAYRPPFGRPAWPAGTRIAWMAAGPRGFQPR